MNDWLFCRISPTQSLIVLVRIQPYKCVCDKENCTRGFICGFLSDFLLYRNRWYSVYFYYLTAAKAKNIKIFRRMQAKYFNWHKDYNVSHQHCLIINSSNTTVLTHAMLVDLLGSNCVIYMANITKLCIVQFFPYLLTVATKGKTFTEFRKDKMIKFLKDIAYCWHRKAVFQK